MRCQITIPIFNMDLKAQKTKLYGFANEMVNYLHPYWTSLWFKLVLNTEIWKRKVMQIIRGLHVQSEPGNPLCSLNPLWENKKKRRRKKNWLGPQWERLHPRTADPHRVLTHSLTQTHAAARLYSFLILNVQLQKYTALLFFSLSGFCLIVSTDKNRISHCAIWMFSLWPWNDIGTAK